MHQKTFPRTFSSWPQHRGHGPLLNTIIVALTLTLVMGYLASPAASFEMTPRSSQMAHSKESAEMAALLKELLHWLPLMGWVLWKALFKPTIDTFLGLMVLIGGAFIPDMPSRNEQATGAFFVETKVGKAGLRGAPRYFVMVAGLLIIMAVLYSSVIEHRALA